MIIIINIMTLYSHFFDSLYFNQLFLCLHLTLFFYNSSNFCVVFVLFLSIFSLISFNANLYFSCFVIFVHSIFASYSILIQFNSISLLNIYFDVVFIMFCFFFNICVIAMGAINFIFFPIIIFLIHT